MLKKSLAAAVKPVLLFLFSLFYFSSFAQTWQPAGPNDNGDGLLSKGAVDYTDVAVYGTTPYVIYKDASNGNRATVKKLSSNSKTWENVGIPGFSTGTADYTNIAFSGSTPYIVFQDNGAGVTVMKLNSAGTDWETVGDANLSAGTATYTDIAFDGDIPYVVYRDGANSNKATVMKLNSAGTGWEIVGAGSLSAGSADYTKIAIINSKPYVIYRDNNATASAMKLNDDGTAWIAAGNPQFSSGTIDGLDIASNGSTPYVSTIQGSQVSVMKLSTDGTVWQSVGDTQYSTRGGSTGITIDGLTPYLVHQEMERATVVKFNGSYWENVGYNVIRGQSSGECITMIGANPMVVYNTGANVAAVKFNGTSWDNVAGPGFYIGNTYYMSLAFNGGKPYVSFISGNNNGIKLVKYDGSIWNPVGNLDGYSGEWPVVGFAGSTPYIGWQSGGLGVIKYDGTAWGSAGDGGSDGGVYSPTLAVNGTIPYTAYVDMNKNRKLTVLKLNGTTWEKVGNAGFSTGEPAGTKLFFIGTTPYIGYIDIAINGSRPLVKKFNGTTWEAVGDASIASANIAGLAFASDGTSIYTAYGEKSTDGTDIYKATLMKFNGTQWEPVGPRGFSTGTAFPVNIAFVGSTPYVAFVDVANESKATVMKYNGTTWETVGSAGFSNGKAEFLNFGYDGVSKLYVSYNSGQVPYAKSFQVQPDPLSTNAELSNLAISNGTLNPEFVSTTVEYTTTVASTITSVTVTPTLSDATATVQVKVNSGNYATVTTESASASLALNEGDNTITVLVTAEDGTTTKTYTTIVSRDSSPPTISYIDASTADGIYPAGEILTLVIVFDKAVGVTGTPTIGLNSGGTATYSSGSGGAVLSFNYTILAGQNSTDLNVTSFALNGGSISNAENNINASVLLPDLNGTSSLAGRKNIIVDGTVPTVTASAILSGNAVTSVAKSGELITLSFTTSEAINPPTVTIAGHAATVTTLGNNYTATYNMTNTDTEGHVDFNISYSDLAGNTGIDVTATTNNSTVVFDRTAPELPANFSAISSNTQIKLDWTANTETDLAGYRIYKGNTASPTTLLTTITAPITTYTDAGLTNGLTLYYRITAIDLFGNESLVSADALETPKGPQTVTFNTIAAKAYGTADFDPLATSSSALAVSYSSDNIAVATIVAGKIHIIGVGEANITASQAGSTAYNPASNVIQVLTVDKKEITLALNNTPGINKVYNASNVATLIAANYTLTGVEINDEVTVTGTATYDSQYAGTAKTVTANTFVLAGAQKESYSLSTTSAQTIGNITAKAITVALNNSPGITKTYDGNSTINIAAANYTLSGIETNDQVSVSGTSSYADQNAGINKVVTVNAFVLVGADKNNYSLTTTTANTTGDITTKTVTVTADDKLKFQNTANPTLTIKYNGFITAENEGNLTTQPVANTIATLTTLPGKYPITVSGGVSPNYNFNYISGTLEIVTGAPTNISLAAVSLLENAPTGTLAGTLSTTANDPSATFTYSLVTGEGSANNSLFTVSGNQIRTSGVLNFEQSATYTIRIRTSSQYNLTLDKVFIINLTDVNELPTIADITNQVICYTTDRQIIDVTSITAGPDAGQSTVLSVSSPNNNLFDLLEVNQPGSGSTARLSYRIKNSASGTATINITVTDNGGTANGGINTITKTFLIRVDALPVITIVSDKGTSIAKGETIMLTATGGSSYQWTNASGIISGQNTATLTVRPSEATTYTVIAKNANTCSTEKEIAISVTDNYDLIKGTNILTPNGDGVNDRFIIRNIDMYPKNEVKIFDRAGRLLYSQKNYTNQWDGTLSGSPLAEGTYYYIVNFGPTIAPKKGFITIVRD